jgi:hypothetical protein
MTMVSPGIRWKKDDENIERNQEQDKYIQYVITLLVLVLALLHQDVSFLRSLQLSCSPWPSKFEVWRSIHENYKDMEQWGPAKRLQRFSDGRNGRQRSLPLSRV